MADTDAAGQGNDGFPVASRGLAGLPAEGEGRLSARRGVAFDAGGGAAGGGYGGRHCALRPCKAFVPPALSALQERHALARPVGHHLGQAGSRRVPAMFRRAAAAQTKTSAEVIAIDGKTVRRIRRMGRNSPATLRLRLIKIAARVVEMGR
jgi:hypothetical protein